MRQGLGDRLGERGEFVRGPKQDGDGIGLLVWRP